VALFITLNFSRTINGRFSGFFLKNVVLHVWRFIEDIKKLKSLWNSRRENHGIKMHLAEDSFQRILKNTVRLTY